MVVASIISLAFAEDPVTSPEPVPSTEQAPEPLSPPEPSPPPPDPDPPVTIPVDANSAPEIPRPSEEELEQRYLKAYTAWQQGRWASAGEQAKSILEVAPDYRPAILLRGYALTKKADPTDGIRMLQDLAAMPAETDFDKAIRQRAMLLAARYTDRRRRDQLSLSLGQQLVYERRYGGVSIRSGAYAGVQVPVWDILSVRAEYSGAWAESVFGSSLLVNGPHMALMAVGEFPMKDPVSFLDVGVGPALWVATGLYWKSNLKVYGGMRTSLGYDWRFSRRTGLRIEGGWSWWPGMQEDLVWLTQPLDVRAGLTFWFGK